MKVLIGTPACGQMIHISYLHSIMDFTRNNIPIEILTLGNESLITRARNAVISYFHHYQADYSHLLFLDADIALPSAGLKHMLDLEKDVVGGAVPLKGRTAENKPIFNVGNLSKTHEENIYTTNKVGTAVLLLTRNSVAALVDKARQEQRVYKNSANYVLGQDWESFPMYDVFRVGVKEGVYLSEDFWVCDELTELGFPIYVDGTVAITHHGNQAFKPN